MKISEVMRGVKRLAFDTSPLIYFTETHAAYYDRVRAILEVSEANKIDLVTSVVTFTEVLVKPIRVGDRRVEQDYRALLLDPKFVQLVNVNRDIAIRAAQLRAGCHLKTPDALQAATALVSGCDAFLTNDVGVKRVTEIRVLVLDELELDPAP